MEPRYSEEKPMMSTRLGSGGRVGSGGTKRASEFPILSSSTSSSDDETTTTDYYSYEASVLSPGGESVATNASDTSLSLRVDEFTNYRLPGSGRTATGSDRSSTSAQSQRSTASSVSSRHRKKRVTDSGSVAGASESSRAYNNSNQERKAAEPQHADADADADSKAQQNESSLIDSSGLGVAVNVSVNGSNGNGSNSLMAESSSIPVMNTVTISAASSMHSLPLCSNSSVDSAGPFTSSSASTSTSSSRSRSRVNSLEMELDAPASSARSFNASNLSSRSSRLLRGRQQQFAELKADDFSAKSQTQGPVRLRPLPKSFFQQPNRPSPIPPGVNAFPLLPPLGDEQLSSSDDSPKVQRRSAIYVGNIELLYRLFDRVERERDRDGLAKERKSKIASPNATSTAVSASCGAASYQKGNRSNSSSRAAAAPCSKLLNSDPFLLDNITNRLFPELCLDQQETLSLGCSSKSLTLTLPSLGHAYAVGVSNREINYTQMLSELVTQI